MKEFFFSRKLIFFIGEGLAPPEALAPTSDETPAVTPPTVETPTGTTGSRAGVTPSSAARSSYRISPLHLVLVLGAVALKY